MAGLTHLHLARNRIGDVSPLASLTGLKVLKLSDNTITFGVAPLILLKQAASISLAGNGNIGIASAEVDTLEMELGAGVVSRPRGCL